MYPAAGSRLGPYEILGPIGDGGMGEVYKAKETRLGREVAIKVLPVDRLADEGRRRRFVQEAQAASVHWTISATGCSWAWVRQGYASRYRRTPLRLRRSIVHDTRSALGASDSGP